uniref:UBC core domain-containing protein n=1 Tax=Arcella intermedia TaxID=1963864 RepID=A0A6B2LGE5_9EUKA
MKMMQEDPVEGIYCELVGDNLFQWRIYIEGPGDSPYQGGIFEARMEFPKDYPMAPPKLRFISDFWHPNVYKDGRVCISILHPPGEDSFNPDERPEERWLPTQTVSTIMLSVISMLNAPNVNSPANVDASVEWRDHRPEFIARCKKLLTKLKSVPSHVKIPHPDTDPVEREKKLQKMRLETELNLYDDEDEGDEGEEEDEEEEEEGDGEDEECSGNYHSDAEENSKK